MLATIAAPSPCQRFVFLKTGNVAQLHERKVRLLNVKLRRENQTNGGCETLGVQGQTAVLVSDLNRY